MHTAMANTDESNKPIPSNIEAEKSVLAACMLNADILYLFKGQRELLFLAFLYLFP